MHSKRRIIDASFVGLFHRFQIDEKPVSSILMSSF